MGKRGIFQCRILYGKPEPIEVQLSNTKVLLDTVEMDRFVKSIIRRGRTSKDFLSLSLCLSLPFVLCPWLFRIFFGSSSVLVDGV